MNNENLHPKNSTGDTNHNVLIAISTDTLAFLKSKTEIEMLLLDGNDGDALIMEGRIDQIMKMVTACYDARENNKTVKFRIDGQDIIFK